MNAAAFSSTVEAKNEQLILFIISCLRLKYGRESELLRLLAEVKSSKLPGLISTRLGTSTIQSMEAVTSSQAAAASRGYRGTINVKDK